MEVTIKQDGKTYRRTAFHTRNDVVMHNKMQEYYSRGMDAIMAEMDGEYYIYLETTEETTEEEIKASVFNKQEETVKVSTITRWLIKLTEWLIGYWKQKNGELERELKEVLSRNDEHQTELESLKNINILYEAEIQQKLDYQIELEMTLQQKREEIHRLEVERIEAITAKNKMIDQMSDDDLLRGEL